MRLKMSPFTLIQKAFWAIGDIGVAPGTRPEEIKHIRFLNIGVLFLAIISAGWFLQGLMDEKISLIKPMVQLINIPMCGIVYFLQIRRWHTAARIYSFLLFYGVTLSLYPLSGIEIIDHYFIFTGIASAFLVFPRREKRLMVSSIILGFLCYLGVLGLYTYIVPAYTKAPPDVNLTNQIILYNIFIIFFIFMLAGRYFNDKTEVALMEEREKSAEMTTLLKKMFGRYLSKEVMNSLIANPSALAMGGEKREVTILMTDLRGFTALSERLQPEQVVQMLNAYFEVMVDFVLNYNGTVNEIIGDALLIIFGAPQEMPNRTQQAVACAIEMQNAMTLVNAHNRASGLPKLEMGIALNEAEVIVGNIGSSKRSNYTAVGSGVNMTSRIESYAVGGQILISESVYHKLRDVLRIDGERKVSPKGAQTPLRIFEVGAIAGRYNLTLLSKDPDLITLIRRIPFRYSPLDGKDVGKEWLFGSILRLSKKSAEIHLAQSVAILTNLKINLTEVEDDLNSKDLYAKVFEKQDNIDNAYVIRFTAMPIEVSSYFQSHRHHALKPDPLQG